MAGRHGRTGPTGCAPDPEISNTDRRHHRGGNVAMENTKAMCTSFKTELLTALHALGTTVTRGATTADSLKAALYLTTATINAATTAYSATNEVSGTGYTAGGIAVPNATAPTNSGTTAFWTPSGSLVYTSVTLSTAFDCVLMYNSTQSNKAISVHTFGAQTPSAGNFTLTMQTNDASNALIRLA